MGGETDAANGSPPRRADLDRVVSELRAHATTWAEMPVDARIRYLREMLAATGRVAGRQVRATAVHRGFGPDSHLAGEEWLAGPYTQARALRLLLRTLEGLKAHGAVPVRRSRMKVLESGRLSVTVVPSDLSDRILFSGFRAEVRMETGVDPGNLAGNMASAYRRPPAGKVALVLGAGNVSSIPALDAVHKLFTEGQVVILKLNPVNDYLKPFLTEVLAGPIRDGFARIVSGGVETGNYLCHHEEINEIHITGNHRTYDAIVFGPGEEGDARRRRDEPILTKRITGELGNVGPVIVVPGRWSAGEILYHAENLATQVFQNAGFNCNAARMIVTHAGWPQREEFLDRLRGVLRTLPARRAYYPGSEELYDRFVTAHPEAEPLGARSPGVLPPTLITGLDPAARDDIAFNVEPFCAISGETALSATSPGEFLDRAIAFCNGTLHGTLSAGILIDPDTRRDLGDALESAVSALRYGTVVVNHWPALGFALGATTWGAFPGHARDDIQSGTGIVHNTMLFDRPRRSVIYGPFRSWPKPPWFLTHRNAHRVGRRMVGHAVRPSALRVAGIAAAALRS